MAKTVIPDGKKVSALREDRGWNQQDLANTADVSLRTVQSIEQGKGCLRCTLLMVAKALGVEFKLLVAGYEEPVASAFVVPNPMKPTGARMVIQITFDVPTGYDQTILPGVLQNLRDQLGANGEVNVKAAKEGESITLDVEMDVADILQLLQYRSLGLLDEFKIKAIRFPDGVRFPTFQGRLGPRPLPDTDDEDYIPPKFHP